MPTQLRQFPEVSRSGTQQTAYIQIPMHFDELQLTGQAAASVLSDPANSITFTILASPTGQDSDARVLEIEYWQGGQVFDKTTQTTIPTPIDVAFALDARHANERVALRAAFNQPMVVGATLTGLP